MRSNATFRFLAAMILLPIIQTCTPVTSRHLHKPTIAEPNQRLELERVSFLPPRGQGWRVYRYVYGSMGLYVDSNYENIPRSLKVSINPFDEAYQMASFDKVRLIILEHAAKNTKSLKNHTNKTPFLEAHTAEFVMRGGMRCMKEKYRYYIYNPHGELGIGIFGGGKRETTHYTCEQPHQPRYMPYISIELLQIAPPGTTLMDAEYFLEPIFNSLEFKALDLKTSPGYRKVLELRTRREKILKGSQSTQ